MNLIFNHLDPLDPVSAALYEASRRHDSAEVHRLLDQDILRRPDPDQGSDAIRIHVPRSLIDLLNDKPEHFLRSDPVGTEHDSALSDFYLCVSPEGLVVIDQGHEVIAWDWAFMSNIPRHTAPRALADWLGRSTTQEAFAHMLASCSEERGNLMACHQLHTAMTSLPRVEPIASTTLCEIFIDGVDDDRLHEPVTVADLLDEVITRETFSPHVVLLDPPEVVRAQVAPMLARELLTTDRPLPYAVVRELHQEGLLPGDVEEHLLANAINAIDADTALALVERGVSADVRGHAGRPVAHVLRSLHELARLRELGGDVMARDGMGETALSLAERRIEESNQPADREIAMYLRSLLDHHAMSSAMPVERPSRAYRRM